MTEKEKSQNQNPPKEEFQSWDPFTQSKFIYEINKAAGTPVSRPESYKTATLATQEPALDSFSDELS